MTAVFSKSLNVFTAETIKTSIVNGSSNIYLMFGHVKPWATELSPDVANTCLQYKTDVWKSFVGGKKITGSDVRNGIKRNFWTTGTVYNAYDDRTIDTALMDGNNKMIVVTSDNHVYKCLANNYGANSTVKPTSTITTTDFQTADGYIWKYLYTLTAEDLLRFATTSFIPVKTLTINDGSPQYQVQTNAIDGAIHNILVLNSGSGYTSNNHYVTITGDGTGANAYPLRNLVSNTISSIVVDAKGSGYTYANVTIWSATGSGANARAIMSSPGGHGSDPLYECGGDYLLVNMVIQNTEGNKLSIANDFRQIALIKNPRVYGSSGTISSNTVINQIYKLTLTGSSVDYVEDEYVYQGPNLAGATFKGTVVGWDSSNNIVTVTEVEGTPSSTTLYGYTSGAGRFVSSVSTPDLQIFSGRILFIDNFVAIERAINQSESFNITFKF
jgi:hypothetical protein